ncbi:MAG: energy-coupling factor ABC transporter permease [Acidobacteriota bacterium]
MHMADALLSPAVGGAMWAAAAGVMAYSARKVKRTFDDRRVPLMGVLGAFVFSAQMINFSIPGTGSSGHLGGGMILSILLGPSAAFVVMASVLAVQALLFADGGLLALGCNIFNLGFIPAFVAYPLVYRPLAGSAGYGTRRAIAAVLASVVALQLGAFCVVLETTLSGVSEIPFVAFLLLMQSIHLAIGLVEGVATAGVIGFIARARPELLSQDRARAAASRPILATLVVIAIVSGGALCWLASSRPDGLEWSIARATGKEEIAGARGSVHRWIEWAQKKVALLPGYGFRPEAGAAQSQDDDAARGGAVGVDPGTPVSGLVGGLVVLALAALIGWLLKPRRTAA